MTEEKITENTPEEVVEKIEKQERAEKLEKDEKMEIVEAKSEEKAPKKATPDEIERTEKKAQEEGTKVDRTPEEKVEEKVISAEEEVTTNVEVPTTVEDAKPAEEKKAVVKAKEAKSEGDRRRDGRRQKRRGYQPSVGAASEGLINWVPKTELGKKVMSGVVTSVDDVLQSGQKILEPQIVDKLIPEMKSELILIGGRRGKGGGKMRIPIQITATMQRSGRRFKYNAFAVVGDENGLVGIGKGISKETRASLQKAVDRAKMNIVRVKRGCGSWECDCGGDHSIPYKTLGKSGSVRVELMPAPRGLGLVADDESKKVLKLAGIKDVWVKTYGNTSTRINLITALMDALKGLYAYDR